MGGFDAATWAADTAALALCLGLAYAAYSDWVRREVSDQVWLAIGGAGLVLGSVPAAEDHGLLGVVVWWVVGGFVLEHLVPWDERLATVHESLPGLLEIALYGTVGAVVLGLGYLTGFGPSGIPVAALSVFLSTVFARGLFEVGLLYGGADAKAMMVAGVAVPLWATPLLPLPADATALLPVYPFPVTLLMDAALFAIAVPIAIAVRNVRTHDFEFPRGFVSYPIPVEELPNRFVWVKDPTFDPAADEAETSEDDRRIRVRQRDELRARGVERVWVTPQLPFIILLTAGTVAGLVVGNLLFDLAALL